MLASNSGMLRERPKYRVPRANQQKLITIAFLLIIGVRNKSRKLAFTAHSCFNFWKIDVSFETVYLHDLLEGLPTFCPPGRGQQPLGGLRHEQEEGGEGNDPHSNEYLQVERVWYLPGYEGKG